MFIFYRCVNISLSYGINSYNSIIFNSEAMLTYHHLTKSLLYSIMMLYTILIVVAILSLGACKDSQSVDSKKLAEELNEPKSDPTKERDEKFIVEAVEINQEQIMLAKLAQQRSGDDQVKMFARMMEESHRSANSFLSSLAIRKTIAIPGTTTQKVMDEYNKLNEKSVDDFDKEYCRMVVDSHKEAINTFENYTNGKSDPDVQAWAKTMLQELRDHLSKAMEMDAHLSPLSEVIHE